MSKRFSDIDRRSIWEAHGKRCAYCGDPLQFRALFIDHVIPQSLNDAPDELDALLRLCGAPEGFDLHGDLNLVPSCHRCNTLKGAKLFEVPRLMFVLEMAKSKHAKVDELRTKYANEDHADAARIALSLALAKGGVSFEEAGKWLSELEREHGRYNLEQGIKLADGTVLKAVHRNDVERLLDTTIEVNRGFESGLELVHDNGSKMVVRTCREYEKALEDGFYPYTTYAIKMASDFEIPLAVFKAVQRSVVPENTFIRQPRVSVTDLHLMPTTLAPGLSWGPGEDDAEAFSREKSLQGLVDVGRLRIRRAGKGAIVLEDEGAGCLYTELMRADITGDGDEDILVFVYDYATQGTFGAGSTGILSRGSEDAMFTWDNTTLRTRPRSST